MDTGYILIIIAIVCVIAWIVIKILRKANSTELESESETKELESESETKNKETDTVSEESKQITIYEFQSNKIIKICPTCDGENDATAKYCYICGQDLSNKE